MRDDSYLDPQVIELQERSFVDPTSVVDDFSAPAGVLDITQGGTGAATAVGARGNLGLGNLATRNEAAASADTAPVQTALYVQADVQAILDELRDLKTKLRAALILTP